MSTDMGVVSIAGSKIERTCRVTIECQVGADPRIVVEREQLTLDPKGTLLLRQAVASITRYGSLLGKASVNLASGVSITEAQVIEALPLFFDAWAKADAVNPPQQT